MTRLLIVHHTASPGTHELFEAVRAGAATDEIEGVWELGAIVAAEIMP
ncbi:MAG: flavodoxin family protein [Actinoallomurus sp.]|jgi:hypothetical protein|nr:flavodoxin family protein [Actinoallomurus sp.]